MKHKKKVSLADTVEIQIAILEVLGNNMISRSSFVKKMNEKGFSREESLRVINSLIIDSLAGKTQEGKNKFYFLENGVSKKVPFLKKILSSAKRATNKQ